MTRRELFQKVLGVAVALKLPVPDKYILGIKRSAPMTIPINWQTNPPLTIYPPIVGPGTQVWANDMLVGTIQPLTIKELTSMPNTPNEVDSIGDLIPNSGQDGDYQWVEMAGTTQIYRITEGHKITEQKQRRAVLYGPQEERLPAAMALITWYKATDAAEVAKLAAKAPSAAPTDVPSPYRRVTPRPFGKYEE